nr:isoprenyl transferase [Hartmannibacter diazotrophicus]
MHVNSDVMSKDGDSGGTLAVPRHVGIIMDGNGRWARARGLPRGEGHRRGVQTVREIVQHAGRLGISYLTLFSFSSENWNRPVEEVGELLSLLRFFIRRDLMELHKSGVRVRVIGSRDRLPDDIKRLLEDAEALTAQNPGMTLVVAFNYGSRAELVEAARSLAQDAVDGRIRPEDIDEATFESRLLTRDIPDPDLIIRTSGEQRLSNFLLWQAAYAEFVFVDTLWPDFNAAHFDDALRQFRNRERRFGGLGTGAKR